MVAVLFFVFVNMADGSRVEGCKTHPSFVSRIRDSQPVVGMARSPQSHVGYAESPGKASGKFDIGSRGICDPLAVHCAWLVAEGPASKRGEEPGSRKGTASPTYPEKPHQAGRQNLQVSPCKLSDFVDNPARQTRDEDVLALGASDKSRKARKILTHVAPNLLIVKVISMRILSCMCAPIIGLA